MRISPRLVTLITFLVLGISSAFAVEKQDYKTGDTLKKESANALSSIEPYKKLNWDELTPADWDPLKPLKGLDLDKLKDFQRRFTEIGHVPFKDKDSIQNEFRDVINRHFDTLRIDEKRRNLMKFKNKVVNNTTSGRGQNKMRFEREKYMTKLKQMETDLALLDNNIGFFANTKNASALIDDVNQKIVNTKEKIEFLKEKIRIMDSMDEDE